MMLTGIFPFLTYALPAISGFLFSIIVIEINVKWAFTSYITVSVLSMFLVPDKESAFFFVLLFGHYPILKYLIETKINKHFRYIIKSIVFNLSVSFTYLLLVYILRLPLLTNEFSSYSNIFLALLLLFGNVIFCIYDIALSQLIALYIYSYRDKIFKRF